jgi:hypothetical protein
MTFLLLACSVSSNALRNFEQQRVRLPRACLESEQLPLPTESLAEAGDVRSFVDFLAAEFRALRAIPSGCRQSPESADI